MDCPYEQQRLASTNEREIKTHAACPLSGNAACVCTDDFVRQAQVPCDEEEGNTDHANYQGGTQRQGVQAGEAG